MPRQSRVIFFTERMVATADEQKAIDKIGHGVMVRNASKVVLDGPLEECDGVAGAIPANYAAVFTKSGKGGVYTRGKASEAPDSGDGDGDTGAGGAPAGDGGKGKAATKPGDDAGAQGTFAGVMGANKEPAGSWPAADQPTGKGKGK